MRQSGRAQPLSKQDLSALIEGACFMASGGGGPKSMAYQFLDKMQGTVTLQSTAQLADDDHSLTVVGFGSPAKAKQGIGYTAPVNAYHALSEHLNQTPAYLLPGEIGAVNALLPFYVADYLNQHQQLSVAVIDADPCGRAAPRLDEMLLALSGQSCTPAAIASDSSATAASEFCQRLFIEPHSPAELELKARQDITSPAFNSIAGMALFPLTGRFIKTVAADYLVQGSISQAIEIGHALLQQHNNSQLEQLLHSQGLDNRCVVTGQITQLNRDTRGGFDDGKVMIESSAGQIYWIYVRNESLLLWNDSRSRIEASAPDCINLLKHDTSGERQSISTAELEIGQTVTVWAVAAPPQMLAQPKSIRLFSEDILSILDKFTSDRDRINYSHYRPLLKRQQSHA